MGQRVAKTAGQTRATQSKWTTLVSRMLTYLRPDSLTLTGVKKGRRAVTVIVAASRPGRGTSGDVADRDWSSVRDPALRGDCTICRDEVVLVVAAAGSRFHLVRVF